MRVGAGVRKVPPARSRAAGHAESGQEQVRAAAAWGRLVPGPAGSQTGENPCRPATGGRARRGS